VVPVATGKHRRPEAELPQAPGRMPLSTAEYLPSPTGAAGPDPDWSTDSNGVAWPQFNSPPPMLHPDHPSAPVPRVRATGPQGLPAGPQGRARPRQVPDGNPGRSSRPANGSSRLPQRQPGTGPSPGNPPLPSGSAGLVDPAPQGYDSGPYPTSPANGRGGPGYGAGQGYRPGQNYAPAQGYNPGPGYQPAQGNDPGRGAGAGPGYGPGPGHGPGPGYTSAPAYLPSYGPQGYDRGPGSGPGYPAGPGYDTGQGYSSARGYALVQDYEPTPSFPPARGNQPERGLRRLYAVPDDARGPGPAPERGRTTGQFAAQPGGFPRRGAGPLDGGSLRQTTQQPAGQVLTVAEDQAAAITHEAQSQAAAIRQAAEREAAAIRQQAADQAAAVRQTAEREAAELKAALLAMSGELGRAATHVTESLASPGGLATMPTPAVAPARTPAIAPPRPTTRPDAPPDRSARPARPRTRPDAPADRPTGPARPAGPAAPARPRTAPATTSQKRGRQQKAMRIAASVTAASVLFAVGTGVTEFGLHGYKFFVFRATGIGSGGTETDQQFLAQQATSAKAPAAKAAAAKAAAAKAAAAKAAAAKAAAHKRHSRGRHSAKTTG
jgi:hypothetical protein